MSSVKPVYLIAGGRASITRRGPDPMIGAAIALAGVDKPSVAYVGAASGDNAMFRSLITRLLVKAGAGSVRLAPLCGKRGNPDKARKVVEESDVVFMSGGDVDEGMSVLEAAGIVGFLKDLYRSGKPFFGVSAGSIMLAAQWLRWKNPEDDSTIELFPCLGIANVLCDTHGEGEGWEELQALLLRTRAASVSYGITSGSGLVVHPDGTVRALGRDVHRFARKGKRVVQVESLNPGDGVHA